ncbi:hypothetical protein L596_018065 [Steinernema carpocapsae]|uniref:MSP domain-containing protein n=1 Tax=Steinernema carpocapsae TaxID=34508 RepID=A0A4U5N3Z7_STECR|nr:hypothetical protein L596_018065 [Steinernema carpocapsae]
MAVVVKKVASDATKLNYLGGTPDTELRISPKWVVFSSADGYRSPQVFDFTITNEEKVPVVYRLRTKVTQPFDAGSES